MPKLGSGLPVAERFFSKCKPGENGCLLWTAGKDKDGYGKFQINVPGQRKQVHVRAHVFAFYLKHGRYPKGVARHTCDTPACCNDAHLVDGSQKENRSDCVARGREPKGELKPNAVLTDAIVREILALPNKRGAVMEFARSNGLPYHPVWAARHGRSWRHVQ